MTLLLAAMLTPGLPGLLGDWRVGDEVLEVGDGGDLGPGGEDLHLDGDPPVLVRPVLHDALIELRLPHLLGQVTPPLCQLEVDVDVGGSEVVAGGGVLAGEEAGGESLPGATWLPVVDTEDVAGVGPLLVQGVAGGDVHKGDVHAGLGGDQPDYHLCVVLSTDHLTVLNPLLPDQQAVLALEVGGGDNEVALH